MVPVVELEAREPAPAPKPPVPEIEIARVVVPSASTALYDAVLANNVPLAKTLLGLGMSAHCLTADGDTALCASLRLHQGEMTLLLIENGADVNAPGLGGQPPLPLACLRRHPDVVQLLLEKGATPNTIFAFPIAPELLAMQTDSARRQLRTERNITPLMACAARGDVEATALLLKHGASTQAFSRPNKRYAINFAAEERFLFIMRLLLGRDPDTEPQLLITVNLSKQQAWVEREGKQLLKTMISSGRRGYETPAGRFVITNKHKDWTSTIYDASMPYFLRLNCGAIGLHSGYVTGSPASHGCIRLPYSVAKKVFSLANVGDEVVILR